MASELLPCDGCGQLASPDHLTRRFQRLEWTTRFRPIHIHTVFLSGISPAIREEFLYAGAAEGFRGEALALLNAIGMETAGKSPEAVLTEFQRRGYFLAHVLECPLDSAEQDELDVLLRKRLPSAVIRLKKSLRPKRVMPISGLLGAYVGQLRASGLDAELLLDEDLPFELSRVVTDKSNAKLRWML
jgi:hypothetical protein